MKTNDLLLGHMEDLAAKATKNGLAASRFLSPAEATGIAAHFAHQRLLAPVFDGGYENAERVRALFCHPDWGGYQRSALFAALRIGCRAEHSLEHREILGALMALGLERDTVGDIAAEGKPATLVCLPELGKYIRENLIEVGHGKVEVAEIGLSELPAKTERMNIITDTVASLRLDAVLASAFGLSRGQAVKIVTIGRVSLDHITCLQPAKGIYAGTLLSVRGLGRTKLLETGGVSHKGRIFVRIGIYGRYRGQNRGYHQK